MYLRNILLGAALATTGAVAAQAGNYQGVAKTVLGGCHEKNCP